MRRRLVLAAPFLAAAAPALAFPARQVHFVVPFGPAGGVDFTARVLSDALGSIWGTPPAGPNGTTK